MTIKYYNKQYAGMLPKIFESRSHFMRTFGGTLQVKDGVAENDTFMDLKTIDADVVLQNYNTGANVAMGTGTGDSNRFGPRQEIKATKMQVGYEAPLAIHEGIDDFTVNDIPSQVIAERLAKHAEAWAEYVNGLLSATLSTGASQTLNGVKTEEDLLRLFNEARSHYVNIKLNKTINKVAYVTAEVYNFLVDHKLTTTAKQSNANISTGELTMFKGFILEELADEYFQGNENVYFAPDNVGVVGIGISVTRAMDSEDFAGVALQGAGKYAKYLPDKNKTAILKAVVTDVVEG